MQQKVQFIATLLHDPDLVILDEPFSGLDPINAQALKDAVLELKRRGKTVIFSTHIMDNAEKMCDSVCIIARGEKVLDGTVAEREGAAGARNVALGSPAAEARRTASPRCCAIARLVQKFDDSQQLLRDRAGAGRRPQALLRRLVDAGAAIERFELMQPSLHQIFLQRVGATGVETGMSGHG